MALGADDIQSPGLNHLFVFGPDLFLIFFKKLLENAPCGQHLFRNADRSTHGQTDGLLVVSLLAHFLLGQEFRVAAQHNIGTSTGHVGGDGDLAVFSGHSHDFGFFFMVFGVQDGVLDAVHL